MFTDDDLKVNYEKLRKIIRKRRMTISSFAKRANIDRADAYRIQIDEMMSPEGEYNACVYLGMTCADIRDITIPDPDDPTRLVFYPGKKPLLQWAIEAKQRAERRKQEEQPQEIPTTTDEE